MGVNASTPTDFPAVTCAQPLCVLARSRLPARPHVCSLTYAISVHAGEPIDAEAQVWCVECGIARWMVRDQVWRRGWSGEPHCAECTSTLEWDAELKAFYTRTRHTPSWRWRG